MGSQNVSLQDGLGLNVGRWGNSLAVRLPAEFARQLGVGEGSTLHVSRRADNTFTLSAVKSPVALGREALLAKMREHRRNLPMTTSVIEQLRASARY